METEYFAMKPPKNATIDKLWRGSIDMHIHPGPDNRRDRNFDCLQIAHLAREAGMRAIVLKSKCYPTAAIATMANRLFPGIKVIGSVVLDSEVGGLNREVVECQAMLGAKVLWMPTMSAIQCRKALNQDGGIAIVDSNGKVLPEVNKILKIVKQYNMVLSSGHISFGETVPLFEQALGIGITKMVVTHPLLDILWPPMSIDEIKKLASMGAYIDHTFSPCMPLVARYDPRKIVEAIRAIGAERTIMSTDMPQATDPAPSEGLRMFIGTMLQLGVSEEEIELMVKTNPAKLLDLD
jgi:hypothetical protein